MHLPASTDSASDARAFCDAHRIIKPTAYSSKKIKIAESDGDVEWMCGVQDVDTETKSAEAKKIQDKMSAMREMYFEIDDDEVDEVIASSFYFIVFFLFLLDTNV